MKKKEKWLPFCEYMHPMTKLPPPPPPKVWVSNFSSVNRNGISASAIMKKYKNGCHLIHMCDIK